jgi:chromosome segregation protein
MFLKELEMVGFKSFPERTTLKFESGITAIVGPNGCGKSNIFDGIRWVLGEQSTKALRSIKMEDVIFNGTDGKPPLGMAEVTLVFSNKARKLAFENDEVEVCRRIFRSGESQYLLNKTPVRLKDVEDLFMGTGIGAESYSLVEQGKIDLILSTRPEERRLIFDEASGITKYKAQKKEALRKLEEVEQNLLRINDIITEVKREINSLERQANKARRYKEAFEELKGKETNLANSEIKQIDRHRQDLQDKINVSQDNIKSFELKKEDVGKEISLRHTKIVQLETEISRIHDRLINIDNQINNNIRRVQMNKERQEELGARILSLKDQLKQAKMRIGANRKNLEDFQNEYKKLKDNIAEKQALLSEKQKEYKQTDSDIKSNQDEIKLSKNHILDLVAVSSQIKNEITDLQAQLKSQILRKKRLDIERIKSNEERENLSNLLNGETSQFNNLKNELGSIKEEQKQNREKLTSLLDTQEKLSQDIQDLENEKIALESQREFLQELKLKYEGISQSLNAVVYLERCPKEGISGMVIKVKEPPSPIKKQEKTHLFSAKFKLSGEAKPMPLETQAITQKIEKIKIEIEQRQKRLESIQKQIQELNQILQNLDQKAQIQERLISNKSLQIGNLTEQLDKINQEYEVVNLEIEDLEKQIEQLNYKQTQLESSLTQAGEKHKEEEDKVTSFEDSIVQLRSQREQTLVEITQIKTEIENQNANLNQHKETQILLENAYQESQQLYERYLDEIGQSESKVKQLADESGKLEQDNEMVSEEAQGLNKKQDEQQAELQQLGELQEKDDEEIALFNRNIEGLKQEVYEYQMQEKELDFKQRSIRDRISQVYKVDPAIFTYEETLRSRKGGVDLQEGSVNREIPQDKEALVAEISELKQKIDSLGTVNLIAIEEYEELKKRYDFLTHQQNDLNQARQSLNEAINKINRTTKQMFLETFKKIQIEFRNYFRMLFGGGDAQLLLTEEAKPLESGIEIICRPRGKKLQNILALSGGEKSLAAVALMFAIFKVKPAPFCVLDEVDAALDEANIGRFSGILQDFSKGSQFLVITHNKRTIANADVMYGITMQEPGISKIVSVKLS